MSTNDRDELAELLDRHLSERDNDQGCRLACGYDGDERAEHLAAAIVAAGWRKVGADTETHTEWAVHYKARQDGETHRAYGSRDAAFTASRNLIPLYDPGDWEIRPHVVSRTVTVGPWEVEQ